MHIIPFILSGLSSFVKIVFIPILKILNTFAIGYLIKIAPMVPPITIIRDGGSIKEPILLPMAMTIKMTAVNKPIIVDISMLPLYSDTI